MRDLLERLEKMQRGDKTLKREYRIVEKALKRKFVGTRTPYGEITHVAMGVHGSTGGSGPVQTHNAALGAGFSLSFDNGENYARVGFFRPAEKAVDSDYEADWRGPDGKERRGKVRNDNVEADLVAFVKGCLTRMK